MNVAPSSCRLRQDNLSDYKDAQHAALIMSSQEGSTLLSAIALPRYSSGSEPFPSTPSPGATDSILFLSDISEQERVPRNLPEHSLTAWDKKQRVGEASNPGPEPPRELYLDRKNGQRDPIRLCTQNGGWVWNVHCVPPLRVAKRSTPHDALRNWLNKHENAIQPASAEAARQLANEWEAFPVPQPTRRTRSLPPRGDRTMQSETSLESSPPRETPRVFRNLTPLLEDASEARPQL